MAQEKTTRPKGQLWGNLRGDGASWWTPEWDETTRNQDCGQPNTALGGAGAPARSLAPLSITEPETPQYL